MVKSKLTYTHRNAGIISKVIARIGKVPMAKNMPSDPRERAQYIQEERDRAKFLKQKYNEGTRSAIKGDLMPSSFIEELIYFDVDHKVHAKFGKKWYTFYNVLESIFTSWFKGQATCMTDDNQRTKRWIVGKTPSLGAFFNTYIKNKYTWVRGQL